MAKVWGLNDVDLEYTDEDFQNLSTFKLFQQTYSPRLQVENPKVPMSQLVMLVAAKWRDFDSMRAEIDLFTSDDDNEEVDIEDEARGDPVKDKDKTAEEIVKKTLRKDLEVDKEENESADAEKDPLEESYEPPNKKRKLGPRALT